MNARVGGTGLRAPVETPAPAPPRWLADALGRRVRQERVGERGALAADLATGGGLALLRFRLSDAGARGDAALERGAEALVGWVRELLRERGEAPLRFWNFVPGIRRPAGRGLRRYEVFNAGRHRGLAPCASQRNGPLAAASAVGNEGPDLVTYLLAGKRPGTPVESPRQRPAPLYSKRYGDPPPLFARATLLSEPVATRAGAVGAFVSGTASIVGEDTRHAGEVAAQLEETLRNLAAISSAVMRVRDGSGEERIESALARYRHLRVYVPEGVPLERVLPRLAARLPRRLPIEWTRAELCRPELRVEIEGTLAAGAPDEPR